MTPPLIMLLCNKLLSPNHYPVTSFLTFLILISMATKNRLNTQSKLWQIIFISCFLLSFPNFFSWNIPRKTKISCSSTSQGNKLNDSLYLDFFDLTLTYQPDSDIESAYGQLVTKDPESDPSWPKWRPFSVSVRQMNSWKIVFFCWR